MMTPELYSLLLAEKPKIPGCGEDGFSYSFKDAANGYIAAFDGCGGMGAKKYEAAGGRTGAYIASRVAAFMTDRFYEREGFVHNTTGAEKYRSYLNESLLRVKKDYSGASGIMIKSNMFRELPSTAAVVSMEATPNNTVMCQYLWAGDSRGFFLDCDGMCQVTSDEVMTEEDAFSSLRNDAKLRNVLHAGESFELSSKNVQLSLPAAVIVATDGAFGYLLTPMHFEHIVLSSLFSSSDEQEWQAAISKAISAVSGDDFVFIAALFGFDSFREIREYFQPRYNELCKDYIIPSANAGDEQLLALWEKYKEKYYRR